MPEITPVSTPDDLLSPQHLRRLGRLTQSNGSVLLSTIEGYLQKTGTKMSAFGVQAMNDAGFVQGLRGGRQCKPETAEKVIAYITRCPLLQAARGSRSRRAPGNTSRAQEARA